MERNVDILDKKFKTARDEEVNSLGRQACNRISDLIKQKQYTNCIDYLNVINKYEFYSKDGFLNGFLANLIGLDVDETEKVFNVAIEIKHFEDLSDKAKFLNRYADKFLFKKHDFKKAKLYYEKSVDVYALNPDGYMGLLYCQMRCADKKDFLQSLVFLDDYTNIDKYIECQKDDSNQEIAITKFILYCENALKEKTMSMDYINVFNLFDHLSVMFKDNEKMNSVIYSMANIAQKNNFFAEAQTYYEKLMSNNYDYVHVAWRAIQCEYMSNSNMGIAKSKSPLTNNEQYKNLMEYCLAHEIDTRMLTDVARDQMRHHEKMNKKMKVYITLLSIIALALIITLVIILRK